MNPYGPQGYPGWPQPYGHPPKPSPATAIMAVLAGALTAAAVIYLGVDTANAIDVAGSVPDSWKGIAAGEFAGGGFLALGALLLMFRSQGGPPVMGFGALITVATLLAHPSALGIPFDLFFEHVLEFPDDHSKMLVLALVTGALALLFAILPPTTAWVRWGRLPRYPMPGHPKW